MKRVTILFLSCTLMFSMSACGQTGSEDGAASDSIVAQGDTISENVEQASEGKTENVEKADKGVGDIKMKVYTAKGKKFSHAYNVADIDDEMAIYKEKVDKSKCFFVISKKEFRLYVYEAAAKDTALVASFPVCYAKNPGPKTKNGDMSTPECTMKAPFFISEIKDASTWCHNFNDGRGDVRAYGAWFMRLDLSKSNNPDAVRSNRSIGIHGSTSNVQSVPGRDSEGCIRLRDDDLLKLKSLYAQVGTKVLIKGVKQGKLSFELKAEKSLGDKYKAPKAGNPLFKAKSETTVDGHEISDLGSSTTTD